MWKAVVAGCVALQVSACASLYAEPCTDQWFEREAREAFRPIRSDLGPTLRDLEAATEIKGDASLWTAWRMARAFDNLARLIEAFDKKSLPRLQAAAGQCNDPGFVRRAIFDFLEDEGIEDIVKDYEGLERLLAPAS